MAVMDRLPSGRKGRPRGAAPPLRARRPRAKGLRTV